MRISARLPSIIVTTFHTLLKLAGNNNRCTLVLLVQRGFDTIAILHDIPQLSNLPFQPVELIIGIDTERSFKPLIDGWLLQLQVLQIVGELVQPHTRFIAQCYVLLLGDVGATSH